MSLLDTPTAKALLGEATLTAEDAESSEGRLQAFLQRYLQLFCRKNPKEERENAGVVMRGLLSDLERKTAEPVACRENRERPKVRTIGWSDPPGKPIQFFVGRGKWDDEAVMAELRRHVTADLADPDGVLA